VDEIPPRKRDDETGRWTDLDIQPLRWVWHTRRTLDDESTADEPEVSHEIGNGTKKKKNQKIMKIISKDQSSLELPTRYRFRKALRDRHAHKYRSTQHCVTTAVLVVYRSSRTEELSSSASAHVLRGTRYATLTRLWVTVFGRTKVRIAARTLPFYTYINIVYDGGGRLYVLIKYLHKRTYKVS
jgi:hypothetical protein